MTTKTTQFTPGPWHLGMKPGPMVYGPQGEQVVPLNLMLDMPEVTANAHLIAAAPAMYEALVAAYEYLAEMGCDCEEGQACGDCIVCQVREAKTQAEGRQA